MSGSLKIIFILTTFLFFGCINPLNQISPSARLNLKSTIPRSELTYRGVVQRTAELKFNIHKSEISEITALIYLPTDYNDTLKYKWTLGEGVSLHSGYLENNLEKYEKNKPLVLKILVKGFNTESLEPAKHVRFEILSDQLNRRIFADGLVSSNQENSFEDIVKQVENYKIENYKKENSNEK